MKLGYVCDIGGDHFLRPVVERFGAIEIVEWPHKTAIDALFIEWAYRYAIPWLRVPSVPPIIIRCHSFEVFQPEFVDINWPNAAAVIFVAQHVLDYAIANRGFPADHPNVHVIPCGIDLEHFTPPPDKVYGKTIGWVGSLNVKKGPMLLAQVIKAVVEWDAEFQFRLVGGPHDPRMETYFWHALDVMGVRDNVTHLGRLPADAMRDFYRSCDYILSTTPWEGTAQSVGEGIACGCVPLVHAWPGAEVQYPGVDPWTTPEHLIDLMYLYVGKRDVRRDDSVIFRAALPPAADCLDWLAAVVEGVCE